MKNRYLLSMLIGATLLYYAMPFLSFHINGMNGIFGIAWVLFALMVIGGNLAGILFGPNRPKKAKGRLSKKNYKVAKRRQVMH